MSLYTVVLRKIGCKKQLENWQRQLGKTLVVKAGGYIVSVGWETTCMDKIASNLNSIFAGNAGFLLSGSQLCTTHN